MKNVFQVKKNGIANYYYAEASFRSDLDIITNSWYIIHPFKLAEKKRSRAYIDAC